MGCLRSPDSKKSSAKSGTAAKDPKRSTFRVESKDETYTVSSAETTLQEEKESARSDVNDNLKDGELKAKMSAFAGLDVDSLRDLISKASSGMSGDPAFYSKLVENLLTRELERPQKCHPRFLIMLS